MILPACTLMCMAPRGSSSWPSFVNGQVAIRRWTHPDGNDRVYLIKRADGGFTLEAERLIFEEMAVTNSTDGYVWVPTNRFASHFDPEEIAIREIHLRYPWTQEMTPENRAL